jgi:SAM domain (Sterile alpha motif)
MPSLYMLRRWLTPLRFRYSQGRNLEGKVGLFPESYVQPAPPSTEPPPVPPATAPLSSALADKAQSSAASLPTIKPPQIDPVQEGTRQADTAADTAQNQSTAAGNGEVMRATMTDVQQAIEQLGHKDDLDGSRSFTFSSTRDESTDRDTDLDTDVDVDGEDWHKSARQKLAEKAKKVVEEQAARDAIDGRVTLRSTAPPIDVELSDDSGDEGDGPFGESSPPNGHGRKHPHIPEDEEVDITAPRRQVDQKRAYSPSIQPSERYIVPSPISTVPHPESGPIEDGVMESAVATATQPSFSQNARVRTPENKSSLPSPVSPGLRGISNGVSADAATHPSSAQLVFPSKSQTLSLQEATGVLPSPAASSNGHRHGYSISSMTSSALNAPSPPLSAPRSSDFSANKKPRDVHPSEWNVEEVIDWLRSKGFDDMVCDKFIEQEITGDVLLELDVGVLKSEIGIVAYGKRIRIANAISELRRPPSIMSSEQLTRSASLSQGSPLAQLSHSPATLLSTGFGALTSPESPSDLAESVEQPTEPPLRGSDPGVRPKAMESDVTVGLGLGIPSSLLVRNGEGKPVVSVLLLIK